MTQDQKTKLAELQTRCDTGGCTVANRETFLKEAESILSAEQFVRLKHSCRVATKSEKPQS